MLGDERARRELAERGYQGFSARSQAAILDRALSAVLESVTNEIAARDDPRIDVHLEGKDDNEDHQLRERHCSPAICSSIRLSEERDRLLAKVKANPEDARSVFFLAETYFQLGDSVDARERHARRVEMGGCDDEVD